MGLSQAAPAQTTCPHCGKQLKTTSLQGHINAIHGTHEIPCTEAGCKILIKHPDAVRGHMVKFHSGGTCEHCGMFFKAASGLSRHMREAHTEGHLKRFVCEICSKGFEYKNAFDDHLDMHAGIKRHACKYCDLKFSSFGTAAGHMRSVHLGKKRKNKKSGKPMPAE